jgi:ribosome-associated translation inhibitor RaiA
MRIKVLASGFELTNHTRSFAESRLRGALNRFRDHIEFVSVHLHASGPQPEDLAECRLAVALHPGGEVRARSAHAWLHVAIDRAASAIVPLVEGACRARPGRSEISAAHVG